MRPRIGITAGSKPNPRSMAAYVEYVKNAGGEPVVLQPGTKESIGDCQGLLLSGGVDVHPRHFGREIDPAVAETLTIDEERDAFELPIARAALDARMPVLGICRGFQLLNVVLGGTMVQHLDGHTNALAPEGTPRVAHEVRVAPETRLASMLGADEVPVNSWHHQGVREDDLAPGVRATAWAPDGLVEGIEAADDGWVVGVQWHPERVDEVAPANAGIAKAFVKAAAERVPAGARR